MPNKTEPQTLSDAIENLQSNTKKSLSTQLDDLKAVVDQIKPKVDEALQKAGNQIKDKASLAEQEAKRAIQEKPFVAIGLTALLFALFGFLLGRSSKD